MAGHLDPNWVPSATNTALARDTDTAEFKARTCGYRASSYLDPWQRSVARLDDFCDAVRTFFGAHSLSPHRATRAGVMPHVRWFDGATSPACSQAVPPDAVAVIDVQDGAGSQPQTRHLSWPQQRSAAQALNPQAKSAWKISATITSLRGTS
jgi:hypothetical protein